MEDVLEEIENESKMKMRRFTSAVNQPNLVAVNSTNATITTGVDSYSTFTIDLPRPILQADTIQLINANIPNCFPNIPDTALVFWYYRLSAYSGDVPSLNNLHFVRLLPSYYKKEFIDGPQLFGFNQTFPSYQDLATQLSLATKLDLGTLIWQVTAGGIKDFYKPAYYNYDITLTFDEPTNKFKFTGLNRTIPPAYQAWDVATPYLVQQKVIYNGVSHTCIQANTGQTPGLSNAFWIRDNQPVMASWDSSTTYGLRRYVVYNNSIYESIAITTNNQPDISPLFWDEVFPSPSFTWNRYFSTGYNDPNVAILQNKCYQPYDEYTLFETDDIVDYEGSFYKAVRQTVSSTPPSADWLLQSTPISTLSNTGDTIFVTCDTSLFIGVVIGTPVYIVDTTEEAFNLFPSSFYAPNRNEYEFAAISGSQVVLTNSPNFTASSSSISGRSGRICLGVAPDIGLTSLSGQYDFNTPLNGIPVGIPPQPFSLSPKRLLNSILGFTFNGQFSLEPFILLRDNVIGQFSTPSVYTSTYNRLRPLPPYQVVVAPPLDEILGVNPTRLTTYTAEGYANLVYSSIVSIYASAVGGSTLDTQDNTNLIAQGTMNAGTLGVSFFAPFVETPLLLGGEDIYTLSFTLRDECNDPLILTNNAVVSIVLKVTYKK